MTAPMTPPRWDVSNVYPGLDSPELEADFLRLAAELDGWEEALRAVPTPDSPASVLHPVLCDLVDRYNVILELAGTLRPYIYSFVSTDSYNAAARKALSRYERLNARADQLDAVISTWIGKLQPRLAELTAMGGSVETHAFYLNETALQSRYLMSPELEALAAELGLAGDIAWGKLQGTLTSQLTVDFELDGTLQTLPMPALINLHTHPDEEVRRRAYEAELKAWESVKEPLAAALNGVKGAAVTLNQRRGRSDALHAAIDMARIDRPTLEAMLNAMRDSFPMFRRYFAAKARRLGKDKLAWWDVFAPVGKNERSYTFDEAQEFILENFGRFSPELRDFARNAFEKNWIDAEQRKGKRPGAFCMGIQRVKESRILSNFDGTLDQVSTVAHELGHAFHNHCAFQVGRTPLQKMTPMTMAETASIMCETVVVNAALDQAATPEEQLSILETALIGDAQVIVDIYSRYLFEKEVFERREQTELSAEELCEIMARAQKATYGEALDERYLHPYMWTWKPHYYYAGLSFYNFPYAFGLLFGLGLYAIYRQRGETFLPEYKTLLAGTGLANAADLAAGFGIDLRSPAFWQASLAMIGERIDRYASL